MTTPIPPARLFALVPCAGVGTRAGTAGPKQYERLGGATVVGHTLAALGAVARIDRTLLVLSPGDGLFERAVPAPVRGVTVSRAGGATRAATVLGGLDELLGQGARDEDWVLVHDAARCLVRPEWIDALIDACLPDDVGGLLALPLADTLKAEDAGRAASTLDRGGKWLAQTPQMFRLGLLRRALLAAGPGVTDEASAVEALGLAPLLVPGRLENFKLTYPADFELAARLLATRSPSTPADPVGDTPHTHTMSTPSAPTSTPAAVPAPVSATEANTDEATTATATASTAVPAPPRLRIGEGWDVHALVPGRPLVLGGVTIPHTHGLQGHSDADALCHAITDALFGAAALGDIGRHFPDTDERFKGADSIALLAEAARRVRAEGWEINSIDSTVVAQAPKLAPHIDAMRHRLAEALGLGVGQVNVKAKTAEKMGPVGRGEAMEASAVCLLVGMPGPG